MTEEIERLQTQEAQQRPLWMPKGSVRAIIALVSVVTAVASCAYMWVHHGDVTGRDILKDISLFVIGFYFGTRK
ncbi:MAG: hypothetical protein PHQ43_08840 [Dehalococcoidales bacterium]|nr:hypothetical protein [Dehalococcoidales bacterium]